MEAAPLSDAAGRIGLGLIVLSIVLAGCVGSQSDSGAEPGNGSTDDGTVANPSLEAAKPVTVAEGTPAAEPELVLLPDGQVVLCALDQASGSSQDRVLVFTSPNGTDFEQITDPRGSELVDCSFETDATGRAYLASVGQGTLTTATTTDGRQWEHEAPEAGEPGSSDRPWIQGGRAGEAVAIAYDQSRGGIVAYESGDAGRNWMGPNMTHPADQPVAQAFGNLAYANGTYGFPYGVLEQGGAGAEARDLYFATKTDDGWSVHAVALDRSGNIANVFPTATAGPNGTFFVVWSQEQEDRSTRVFLSSSPDGKEWSEPEAVTPDNRSALMPRAVATPQGPVVFSYVANGPVAPNCEPATWTLQAFPLFGGNVDPLLVDGPVHNGTISTGGYGQFAEAVVAPLSEGRTCEGTANSDALLHTFGAVSGPDGKLWVSWTSDANEAQEPRVRLTHLEIRDGPVG